MKEKGSSSKTRNEGSSKEDEKKGAAGEDKDPAASSKKEKESKDTSGSSTVDNKTLQKSEEENEITLIVIQKNVRSLNSSDRKEELTCEVSDCRCDALLMSESWRSEKAEIRETCQAHIYMGAGKFPNKHEVGILLNKKWKNKVNWTDCISERAIAVSITVNSQPVLLMSVYFHHSGFAEHHVGKAQKAIEKKHTKSKKTFQIVGGAFNA